VPVKRKATPKNEHWTAGIPRLFQTIFWLFAFPLVDSFFSRTAIPIRQKLLAATRQRGDRRVGLTPSLR